mmetsp:Transcript_83055/g.173870  ORF Transcript_83055/g.173870 Transcript_83055/m.173870 type:complete len:89 (+) Transcript_83055:128-394(+)
METKKLVRNWKKSPTRGELSWSDPKFEISELRNSKEKTELQHLNKTDPFRGASTMQVSSSLWASNAHRDLICGLREGTSSRLKEARGS